MAVRLTLIAPVFLLILAAGWISVSRQPHAAPDGAPSAAVKYRWGTPDADLSREFSGTGALSPSTWYSYHSVGHAGNGLRRPEQITVQDGYLQISGLANATSGGMMSHAVYPPYGRWEARMRVDKQGEGKPYHAVIALIPQGIPYNGGEGDLDFAEADAGTGVMHVFIHYPPRMQAYATVDLDLAEWHTYAIEVTPDHISWFVDGRVEMTTRLSAALTGTPWTTNVQLDAYHPSGLAPSDMQVDYFRFYPLPERGTPLVHAPTPIVTEFR